MKTWTQFFQQFTTRNHVRRQIHRRRIKEQERAEPLEIRCLLATTAPDDLFDATIIEKVAPTIAMRSTAQSSPTADHLTSQLGTQVLFIDERVENWETLVSGAFGTTEVVLLRPESDGLAQIANVLTGRRALEAVHIVSHGAAGSLFLGGSKVDSAFLAIHRETLRQIGNALVETGDILVYGCDVGAGDRGKRFVSEISAATGADVAASDDRTGGIVGGGDWELEVSVGEISAEIPLTQTTMRNFKSTLGLLEFAEFVDPNPSPGNQFGYVVMPLSNGNVVITAPFDDAGGTDAGAVYLFNGNTGALISTLRGSTMGDNVGLGVRGLASGNFVVISPIWDNGSVVDAGAVTFGNGTTGISGVVSPSNSLVGSSTNDRLGFWRFLALENGNYVTVSTAWDNGAIVDAGAVTLGNGLTGVSGPVTAANSLIGTRANDAVGAEIIALSNSNFVVSSPQWDNGAITDAGAATFVDGATGLFGPLSSTNSLVGTRVNDRLGSDSLNITRIDALPDGGYVVNSEQWDNGAAGNAGASTYGNGITGIVGEITAENSLVGTASGDEVGTGTIVLTNGNYLVRSPSWNNGAGAVTWGSDAGGLSGPVSSLNSLTGGSSGDLIGSNPGGVTYVTPLEDGNYVVISPQWDNGSVVDAGAMTLGNGTTGIVGVVNASNSLVGNITGDISGYLVELGNGNYVAANSDWDNGTIANAGAVTVAVGIEGLRGTISSTNSLIGSVSGDRIGSSGVRALTNGNYIVGSWEHDRGTIVDAGAVTFGDGLTGVKGVVNISNSLVGSTANDRVGSGLYALTNGNYVVSSTSWDNGTIANAGGATFGNGTTGIVGTISSSNSLVGSSANDNVGSGGVTALTNGNYVVGSGNWNGTWGAATFGNGTTGVVGTISTLNSLIGGATSDRLGSTANGNAIIPLPNGNYIVVSPVLDLQGNSNVGAVTFGSGISGVKGQISAAISLIGSRAGDGLGSGGVTALENSNYLVHSASWDNGSLTNSGAVSFGSGSAGVRGTVNFSNSAFGLTASTGLGSTAGIGVSGFDDDPDRFYARFLTEGSGRVRIGLKATGFQFAPRIAASLSGSTLSLTDSGSNANMFLKVEVDPSESTRLLFSDPNGLFTAGPGTTMVTLNSMTVPIASLAGGQITISGGNGDDTLELDSSLIQTLLSNGITLNYDGGTQTTSPIGDMLRVTGGSFDSFEYDVVGTGAGNLSFDNQTVVNFTGLEPVTVTSTADTVILDIDAAGTIAGTRTTTLSNVGGNLFINLDGGLEDLTIAVPTGELQIRGDLNSNDTITVSSLPPAFGATVVIDSRGGTDVVNLNTDIALSVNNSLFVTAESVIIGAGVDVNLSGTGVAILKTDTIAINATATLTGSASVTIQPQTAALQVSLGSEIAGRMSLTDAELDRVTAGSLIVGSSAAGLITVGAAITHSNDLSLLSGTGVILNSSVTMAVNRNLTVTSSSAISGISLATTTADVTTSGSGTVTLTAIRDISLSSGSSITTVDGGITLMANPDGNLNSNSVAVSISDATIQTSGSGPILLTGRAGNDAAFAGLRGVFMTGPTASIRSTAVSNGGTISVIGIGGQGIDQCIGVDLVGQSTIQSHSGDIFVQGRGAGTRDFNAGVRIQQAGIESTGTGPNAASITIHGTGAGWDAEHVTADNARNSNDGVRLENGTNPRITSVDGNITINAVGGEGTGSSNHGLFVFAGGRIASSGSGSIAIDGYGGIGGFNQTGVAVSGAGSIVTVNSGGLSILGTGGIGTSNQSMGVSVNSFGTVSSTGAGPVLISGVGGTGATGLNYGVTATFSGLISGSSGSVTVSGQGGTGGSSNIGININNQGTIQATGLASLSVTGTGGASAGDSNRGVSVEGTNSVISSGNGMLTIAGLGGGSGNSGRNDGVFTSNSGRISSGIGEMVVAGRGGIGDGVFNSGVNLDFGGTMSTGSGNMTVVGYGGASDGNVNNGVSVRGGTISSAGGNLSITGEGGGTGTSPFNRGVFVNSAGRILANGNGTILVDGKGGITAGIENFGVDVTGDGLGLNSMISSSNGDVTVIGIGGGTGPSHDNIGVRVAHTGSILAGGAGNLIVRGSGGAGTGGLNVGVSIIGADGPTGTETPARIASNIGDISIIAQGGIGGANNFGMSISGQGSISVPGSASLNLVANGGTGVAGNHGLMISDGIIEATETGPMTVQATPGSGGAGEMENSAIVIGFGGLRSAGGLITIEDSGSGQAEKSLRLDQGSFLTSTNDGQISVTAPRGVQITSGAESELSAGSQFNIAGDLANNGILSIGSPFTRVLIEGDYAQSAQARLFTGFAGTSPGESLDQLQVTGIVSLSGELEFDTFETFLALGGDPIVLIDNQGTNPVAGEFSNRPEGSLVIFGADEAFQLTYHGGDGNDIELLPATVYVTNTTDAGSGSLRAGIDTANRLNVPARIEFQIPGTGPQIIHINSALPAVTNSIVIDASSQPSFADIPLVIVQGPAQIPGASVGINGLEILADNSSVIGLQISGFTGDGIHVDGASHVTIEQSVLSGHKGDGVVVDASSSAFALFDSIIGLNPERTQAYPNGGVGVRIVRDDSSPTDDWIKVEGNSISGNSQGGVWFLDLRTGAVNPADAPTYRFAQNRIGLDVMGAVGIGNGRFGMKLEGMLNTNAFAFANVVHNLISGQTDGPGLWVENSGNWSMTSNIMGTDVTTTIAVPNDIGLFIRNGFNIHMDIDAFLGLDDAALLASGNTSAGVLVEFDDDRAVGGIDLFVRAGTAAFGGQAVPNGTGVIIRHHGTMSDGSAEDLFGTIDRITQIRGYVSGNLGRGIQVEGEDPGSQIHISAMIGTGETSELPLPNRGGGVLVASDSVVTVLDASAVIAFNRGPGVRHEGLSGGRNIVMGLVPGAQFEIPQAATIAGNVGLGIDLGSPGPSANSGGQNDHPVLTSATYANGFLDVTGTNSSIGGHFLQFFATRPTVSGRGQGHMPIGSPGLLNGLSRPASLVNYLNPGDIFTSFLPDLDPDAHEFRYRIPVGDNFETRLLTAVIIDPTLGQLVADIPGSSEFSPIIPVGTQLTALPPVVDAGGDVSLSSGDTLSRTVSFRDEDSVEFEVVVDYGDGSGFEYTHYRRADRTIFLEHTYHEIGQFVVSVSVLDDTQPVGIFDIDSFNVIVLDTPPEIRFNEVQLTKRIFEGETVNLQASFDDAGINDLHTASVNWGDGTSEQSLTLPVGVRTFELRHQYLDDGVSRAGSHVYRVVVSVRDESGAVSATPVFLVEVDNVLPSNLSASLNTSTLPEGGIANLSAAFDDRGILDSHAVYINWGDGSPRERVPSNAIVQNGAHRTFAWPHVYTDNPIDNSQFFVSIEVSDDDEPLNPVTSSSLAVTVTNLAPIIQPLLLGQSTIEENESVALFVSFDDPGRETHTVVVNWGDGSIEQFAATAGAFSITPIHQYLVDGTYAITATVADRDAVSSSEDTTLIVQNLLSVLAVPVLTPGNVIVEGQSVTLTGSFSDDSIGEHYTVTVNWGDGTATEFAETNSTEHTYSASHLYDDDPSGSVPAYNVTVSVNDGSSVVTTTTAVTVLNERPTLSVIPIIDASTRNPVFRASGFDVSRSDQVNLSYLWSVTQGGLPLTFTYRSAFEIEVTLPLDGSGTPGSGPGPIPLDFPIIVSAQVEDHDGGVSDEWQAKLFYGTSGNDILQIQNSDFESGITTLIALGLTGDDVLDASGVTDSGLHVVFFGGDGNDLLFDGAGNDVIVLGQGNDALNLPGTDSRNSFPDDLGGFISITPNMAGDDEIFLIPNSTLMAYDSLGHNTLNFSLADSAITQSNGITFDLSLTQSPTIVAQDVAPTSSQADTHFVAALGVFDKLVGSNYDDWLTGASNSSVFGGRGADQFFTKTDMVDATFSGGDDADVLTARGLRVARVRFDGDDGPDTLFVDALAEVLDNLVFNGGGDADVLTSRGRVARVIFDGGSDADVLQNLSGRITRVRFDGDDGLDQLINEEFARIEWLASDDPALQAEQGIEFYGGSDADVLINRGRVSRVIFDGGSDADVLQNLSGRITRVRFDGDDGIDQLINEESATIEWLAGDDPALQAEQGIEFFGGSDADVLINRGRVSRVIFDGGSDADVLQNLSGRITRVRFDGDDGTDLLINEAIATIKWLSGDDAALQADQGIEFNGGNDADVLINRGRVSRVIFDGGSDADVLQNLSGRITRVRFDGDEGADLLINEAIAMIEWLNGDDPALQTDQGIEFNGGNDADVLINRGRVSRVIFDGGSDADVLQNLSGRITRVRFDGDAGEDLLINEATAAMEWVSGDDPTLQADQGLEFYGGDDADVLINRGRVSRVIFDGGSDADVLQNLSGRITRVRFDGDDGADLLINEATASIEWLAGDDPSLLNDQGLEFNGGDDADVLINRGRISRVVFSGGADGDLLDLQSGEVTLDVNFDGGSDADVLIVRSRVGRVRFDGDDGADEFLITATATVEGAVGGDGLVEFNGGGDADILVSRGTLRRLVFSGGADDNADDVLQTSGGKIDELEFISESGVGILINRTDNIGLLMFTGSDETDMFINRGQNIGNVTFLGGGGDDVFVNSGSTSQSSPGILTFDAGDGSNAMRNEGQGWAQIVYIGGSGEDFLQNNATGIGLLDFDGGTGSNALENNANGISNIVIQGSNDADIFANDGSHVSGIQFNALDGNNTLINTGANVSDIEYIGGINSDHFINSGFALKDSTFQGGVGDDFLFNSGANTENVTMYGDAGADWWINQSTAVGSRQLQLLAGHNDDAADTFINWAADVSLVTFDGGSGNDFLQNAGLNAMKFTFFGGENDDLLLNLGYGTDEFAFDAGNGDDVFENRGRNGRTLSLIGGAGNDAFFQNAGFAADIHLDGGDGEDTLLNFSSDMGRVALTGGNGDDILQNSGDNIGSLEVTGGGGKNTLQNFGSRIDAIVMIGSGAFVDSFDTLLNSGHTIASIEMFSNVTSTLLTSGSEITAVSVSGSDFSDVVRVTGSNVQSVMFIGNAGDDTLLVDTVSAVGSSISFLGSDGQDLFLFRGTTDGVLFDGGSDNDQVVFSGIVSTAILRGGSGNDLYRFAGTPTGRVTVDENFAGTGDDSRDTLDFSSFTTGPITLDLALTTPQPQPTPAGLLIITPSHAMGIENVIGTRGADRILGNARENVLTGAQFLPTGSGTDTPVAQTKTQWVYLDFGGHTEPGEYTYTETMAMDVQSRMALAFAGFDVRFVLNTSELPANLASDPTMYVTIEFNETPSSGRPGGESSEIDFGNLNSGGTATVQVNGMLGGREVLNPVLKAVAASAEADGDQILMPDLPKPASTVENFTALSAKIAIHELAHLLGVRHYDAFGPIGFGINAPPGSDRFKPIFAGIAGAFESTDHLLSSPASVGTDRFNDLRQLYFGEREAIKLALAFSDPAQVRLDETTNSHGTQATASPLNLVTVSVPNLATGGLNADKTFNVQATSVVGSTELAANSKSESDWYSFAGSTGDIVTIEVMSRALKRYYTSNATSIDSVVRLYNVTGQLMQTVGRDAVNDDEFESSDSLLMDVILPVGGTYFVEVDTFRRESTDSSWPVAVALRGELEARTDLTPDEQQLLGRLIDSLDDTDTGNYELLIYRSASASSTDDIDDIQGRAGVDNINGGPGDDYSLSLHVSGNPSSSLGTAWNGSYLFSDRGGFSWTTTVNYGDGSSSVITSPPGTSRGTQIPLSHVYTSSGTHVITVTVASDDGLTQTQTLNVQTSGATLTATLSGPSTGIAGIPLLYSVSATNPAEGTLTYAWTITRNGLPYATQNGGTTFSLRATEPGEFDVSVIVSNGIGSVSKNLAVTIASGVVSFDVASGMTQRSWIDALDVVFASDQMAADLMANPSRVRLTAFPLTGPGPGGSGGVNVNFGGAGGLSRAGAGLKLNFGEKVIGNIGRNSTAADGYYRLDLDYNGDGLIDATEYFYRLLGDVNGDRIVNATDANLILAGTTKPWNRELDINGDGFVNGTDRIWTQRSNGRKLKDGLFIND